MIAPGVPATSPRPSSASCRHPAGGATLPSSPGGGDDRHVHAGVERASGPRHRVHAAAVVVAADVVSARLLLSPWAVLLRLIY